MSLELKVVNDFADAPSTEKWNGILGCSPSNVVFLTRQYQQVWWEQFCNSCQNCSLNLLVFSDGGGPLGLAPLYLSTVSAADVTDEQSRAADWQRIRRRYGAQQAGTDLPPGRTAGSEAELGAAEPPADAPKEGERMIRFVGGVDVTDYLDVIAAADQREAVWAATFDHLAERASEWDVIDLHSLPGTAGSVEVVQKLAEARGWAVWSDVEETCPVAELPATWEDFLANLSKKDRHELRRKMRRAEEKANEIEYRLLTAPDDVRAAVEQFITLLKKSDTAKEKFMQPEMEGFFRSLINSTTDEGWPEVALLYAEERPVAAYLSFNYADRIHLYNSGFDPAHGGYSAGFVLLVRRLQEAVESDVKLFDFLRGDERYKYDLGGHDQFIHRVIIRK